MNSHKTVRLRSYTYNVISTETFSEERWIRVRTERVVLEGKSRY